MLSPNAQDSNIQGHYNRQGLDEAILAALTAAGKDISHLKLEDLAPVDEFHIRGREATRELASQVKLSSNHKVLDVGSGVGGASRYLASEYGCQVIGLDLSDEYCRVAESFANRLGLASLVTYRQGSALDMPFEDNSFDYAVFCLSLEFMEDPKKALEEACRVAKDGVFVGILNKYAWIAFQRRIRGIFMTTVYNRARFFSINEIKSLLVGLLGPVPIDWQTTAHFYPMSGPLIERFEGSRFARKSPFGAFAGIMATPVPRFRTQPLELKVPAKPIQANSRPVSCAEKKTEG